MAMFADVWKHKFQMFLLPSFPSLQSIWKMVSMNNFQWFCKIVFSSLFVFFWNCEEAISNFVPAIVICFKSTFRSTEVHPQLRFLLLLLISETDPVEIRSDPDQQTLLTRFLLIKLKFQVQKSNHMKMKMRNEKKRKMISLERWFDPQIHQGFSANFL